MTVSAQTKLRSSKRELAMRRHVYPSWVAAGRMKQSEADHEIAVMEAIVADYQAIVDEVEPRLPLDAAPEIEEK